MSMIELWSLKLRRRLSSNKAYLQAGNELVALELKDAGDLWVVGRSLCVFRILEVSNLPASKRDRAIATHISLLSPYREPGYWYFIQGDEAKIWIWDEHRRRGLASSNKVDGVEFNVLPEACFTQEEENGAFLYQASEGFFAQVWRDGQLVVDSCWNEKPDEGEWQLFRRGLMDADDSVLERKLQYVTPWPAAKTHLLQYRSAEVVVLQVLAVCFVCLFAFQLVGMTRLALETWQLEGELSEISATHQETIALREQAFEEKARADTLLRIGRSSQLDLLESISAALPASSGELAVWEYERGSLEFVMTDDAPDLEDYVRKLESIDRLDEVSVEPLPQSRQIRVSAEVIQL